MTTTYNPREDRLRLSVVVKESERTVLWLTQRLGGRLIEALLGEIEQRIAKEAAPSARPGMQMMEQAKAELARKPLPPVRAPEAAEEHLLTNVRIRSGPRQLALIFNWGNEPTQAVALVIDRTRLRQWLRIFHGHYKRAGWPLDIWPQWFGEEASTRAIGREHLH